MPSKARLDDSVDYYVDVSAEELRKTTRWKQCEAEAHNRMHYGASASFRFKRLVDDRVESPVG